MKILLTGATGFLGFRTLERLAFDEKYTSIIATGRNLKSSHKVDHPKVEYILGDLAEIEFVKSLMSGVDIIINTAGLSSPWGSYDAFHQSNVKSMENLLSASQQNDIQRIVHISTPSIYFEQRTKLNVNEQDLPKVFINNYALSKHKADLLLQNSPLDHVIIRPRALTGRGDTVIMPRLIRAHLENKLKVIGDGKNIADLTPVSNVVDAIMLGIEVQGKGLNQIYNISNGEPVELWKAINLILAKLEMKPVKGSIPYAFALFVSKVMETKSRWTNMREPALTQYSVGTMAQSFSLDISKAKTLLGYTPKQSTLEAIEEFVEWYLANEKS